MRKGEHVLPTKSMNNNYKFDKGDLTQTIIIIAGLAVAAIIAIGGIATVTMEKGNKVADCLAKQSTFTPENGTDFENNCEEKNGTDKGQIIWPETIDDCFITGPANTITDYNISLENCSTDVIIPKEINGTVITSIGYRAFYSKNITTLTIPDSVTSIGNSAFAENQLSTITIPDSVTTIGQTAFSTNKLTSLNIPDSVTIIEQGAFRDNKLTSIIIPNSIIIIKNYVFYGNQLSSVFIPDSVTSIWTHAFKNNPITSVSLPTHTMLESYVFDDKAVATRR